MAEAAAAAAALESKPYPAPARSAREMGGLKQQAAKP